MQNCPDKVVGEGKVKWSNAVLCYSQDSFTYIDEASSGIMEETVVPRKKPSTKQTT